MNISIFFLISILSAQDSDAKWRKFCLGTKLITPFYPYLVCRNDKSSRTHSDERIDVSSVGRIVCPECRDRHGAKQSADSRTLSSRCGREASRRIHGVLKAFQIG